MGVSATRHSRLQKHSSIKGAQTWFAGSGVSPKRLNLSLSRPEQLPTLTTVSARLREGIAIMASPVERRSSEAKIGFADDTGDERRFKFHHHMP